MLSVRFARIVVKNSHLKASPVVVAGSEVRRERGL
jgi:hypothetical protein